MAHVIPPFKNLLFTKSKSNSNGQTFNTLNLKEI